MQRAAGALHQGCTWAAVRQCYHKVSSLTADSTTVTLAHLLWLIGADWRRDGLLLTFGPDKPTQPWRTGSYEEEQMHLFSGPHDWPVVCLPDVVNIMGNTTSKLNKRAKCFFFSPPAPADPTEQSHHEGAEDKLRMCLKSESCHLFYTLSWTKESWGPTAFTQWHIRPTGGRHTAAKPTSNCWVHVTELRHLSWYVNNLFRC